MIVAANVKLSQPELSFCSVVPRGLRFVRACAGSVRLRPHSGSSCAMRIICVSVRLFHLFSKLVMKVHKREDKQGSGNRVAGETRVQILPSHRNSLTVRPLTARPNTRGAR
jgi:hypothetical protein